MSKFDS
jgi:hypothetical protein